MSLYAVDLFTDSWLLFNTVLKSTDPRVKRLIPYWIVCWAVATVVSSVSMFIKVKVRQFPMIHDQHSVHQVFVHQFRARREDLSVLDEHPDEHVKKLRKHQKRMTKTSKTIQMIYASMLVGALECLPMVSDARQ
jgi:ABC-type phosphate/phosphonate transport system permease subunit